MGRASASSGPPPALGETAVCRARDLGARWKNGSSSTLASQLMAVDV